MIAMIVRMLMLVCAKYRLTSTLLYCSFVLNRVSYQEDPHTKHVRIYVHSFMAPSAICSPRS